MPELHDPILRYAESEALSGDWAAVAKILNAVTIINRNSKPWTMADLMTIVTPQEAALVGGTIQAAGVSNPIFAGAWIAMNVTGIVLHTDERQAMIDGLAAAGGWSDELKGKVKAAGVTQRSPAQAYGFTDPVTAQECETAWAKHIFRSQVYQEHFNTIVAPELGKGKAATIAALESLITALKAS
jgi:hypothetical protein